MKVALIGVSLIEPVDVVPTSIESGFQCSSMTGNYSAVSTRQLFRATHG